MNLRARVVSARGRKRLPLLVLATSLAIMGLAIVSVLILSQQQVFKMRRGLEQLESQSFAIADHFRYALRETSDHLRLYRKTGDETNWNEFLSSTADLSSWLNQQSTGITNRREQEIVHEIRSSIPALLSVAASIHEDVQAHNTNSAQSGTEQLLPYVRQLSDLGSALGRARYDARNQVLAEASQTLGALETSVFVLVGMLFLAGIALAWLSYSGFFLPLQARVDESLALAERHEKLASLGMLAAGVAHEIRNPLTALKAALFMQQKKLRSGSPEREDAELLEREIKRLEKIVDDFLRFARPADPAFTVVSTEQPLLEVEALLRSDLARSGIHLVRESAGTTKVKIDPPQLKQVLINLVKNAADSLNEGGTITLRAHRARERILKEHENVVVLEVADNGKGIALEIQNRIFDPFFTTKATGTGLGLPIAARIIEKHGGALRYRSEPDHGTTFQVVLPEAQV